MSREIEEGILRMYRGIPYSPAAENKRVEEEEKHKFAIDPSGGVG